MRLKLRILLLTCVQCQITLGNLDNIWVSTHNGNDSDTVAESQHPLKTLQHAINVAPEGANIRVKGGLYEGGKLCVQNLLGMGGSFEDDGLEWILSSPSVCVQTETVHVGKRALTLSPSANRSFARRASIPVQPEHQHRIRFWVRVMQVRSPCEDLSLSNGAVWTDKFGKSCAIYLDNGHCSGGKIDKTISDPDNMSGGPKQSAGDAPWSRTGEPGADTACCVCGGGSDIFDGVSADPSDEQCGVLTVSFSSHSSSESSSSLVTKEMPFPCRTDHGWQYHEAWVPPVPDARFVSVEVRLLNSSSSHFQAVLDDVSVVPFPGRVVPSFRTNNLVDITCEGRLPTFPSGHLDGAREDGRYCDMHLDSGGWELFAMDGQGDKDVHRAVLRGDAVQLPEKMMTDPLPATTDPLPPATIYKKESEYFANGGNGTKLVEVLIVLRNPANNITRWIKIKPSSGVSIPPTTLFDDVPTAPGGGSWCVIFQF
jgi:hypothetical protein